MGVNNRVTKSKVIFINIVFHTYKNISDTRQFRVNVVYMLVPFEMLVNVNAKKFNIMLYALMRRYRL